MVLFNEAKPKYERLDEICDSVIRNIRFSNDIKVIVDLKEILRKFFRPDIGIEGQSRKMLVEEISADIINIIAHYRNYFYKKGKFTSFFFLYSSEKCEEILKIYPEYKKGYYEKYFNPDDPKVSIMRSVTKVVKAIVEIIPHAYFIETSKYDEFVYAKFLKEYSNKNELIFILSNDTMFYQLISENVFVITLKGINSELVNEENAFLVLTKKEENIPPSLIPLIFSIAGLKKYSLLSISNIAIGRATKIVQKLLQEKKISTAETIQFPIELSKLNENNKAEKIIIDNFETIVKNYKIIRNDELLYGHSLTIPLDFISKKKIATVQYMLELNAKIFSMFPLQIDMLLKGEKL